jgi:hypothetical protein
MTRKAHRRAIERQEPWFDGMAPLDSKRQAKPAPKPERAAAPQAEPRPAATPLWFAMKQTKALIEQPMTDVRKPKPHVEETSFEAMTDSLPREQPRPEAAPKAPPESFARATDEAMPFAGRHQDSPWGKIDISQRDRARADRSGVFRYVDASGRKAHTEPPPQEDPAAFVRKAATRAKADKPARKLKMSAAPKRPASSASRWATTVAIVGLSVAAVLGLSAVYPFGAGQSGASPLASAASAPTPTAQDAFAAIEAAPGAAATKTARPAARTAAREPEDALIEVAP